MKITGKFTAPRVNLTQWRKKLDEELTEAIKQSASQWLATAVSAIPVWSGAARATFLDLAQEIEDNVTIALAPNAPNRIDKGRRSGEGKLDINARRGIYRFEYSTDLAHLIFNEFNSDPKKDPAVFANLKNPIPYGFQALARIAWETVALEVRLPSPKYILNKIQVGR